jgi:hypothetical protein
MKNENTDIPYIFRSLFLSADVRALVLEIYEEAKYGGEFTHYPKKINSCYDKALEDSYKTDLQSYNKDVEKCRKLLDNFYIKLLIEKQIITGLYFAVSGHRCVRVEEIDMNRLKEHVKWVKDSSLIRNYGIFSLHTLTGKAYCLDNSYIFDPNMGFFRVFKAFIEKPTHMLSYMEIYEIYYDKPGSSLTKNFNNGKIHSIIDDIKDKLRMKEKFPNMFIYLNDSYFLKNLD